MLYISISSPIGILYNISPDGIPRLGIQVVAAPLSGVSSAVLTNPLDVIRARIQVCTLLRIHLADRVGSWMSQDPGDSVVNIKLHIYRCYYS